MRSSYIRRCVTYAWHGSGQQWHTARVGLIGGAIGGLFVWWLDLRMPPALKSISDNLLWGPALGATLCAAAGVAIVFVVRFSYAPIHLRFERRGGLRAFLHDKLGSQMWPIVLMGSGILAFVVLFGAGATFFLIRLATDAHIPTPGTTSHLAITGTSPLQQAVDNFLARSGKTVDWRPGGGLVQLGDAGDGHGPFITYWDTSLGVWPESTTGSGFTSDQLRKLPRKPPLFKTQTDRDEFRKALGKLSDGVKQAGNVAMKANELRAGIPPGINMPFQPEIWNQAAKQVDAMLGQWDVVDEFFNDQPLLVEYPLYRTELAGILPLPTQQQSTFNSFKHSLISYRDFTNFVFNVQNDTHKRYEEIGSLYALIYTELSKSISDVQDWVTDCNRRIDLMMRAI